jgi:hypothetical protein
MAKVIGGCCFLLAGFPPALSPQRRPYNIPPYLLPNIGREPRMFTSLAPSRIEANLRLLDVVKDCVPR